MKKTGKLLAAAVAFATVFGLLGCSNGLDNISVGTTENVVKRTYTLTSTVTNYSDFVKETTPVPNANPSSRTIMPEASLPSTYIWWLVYNEIGNATKTYVKITDNGNASVPVGTKATSVAAADLATIQKDMTNGEFTISLEAKAYQLEIYAVENTVPLDINYASNSTNNGKLLTNAVLKGTSYIDLSNDSGTAEFTLTTNNLTGAAAVDFDIVLDDWGKAPDGKVEIEVRDYLTNEPVLTAAGTPATTKQSVATAGWTQGDGTKYSTDSYSKQYTLTGGLSSGIYNLVVTFYADAAGNTVSFKWSDIMIVLPNRKLDQPVYIADCVPKNPDAPKWLMASYIADSLNVTENDYEVYFEWTDGGNLEEYYVFELLEINEDDNSNPLYAAADGGNLDNANWDSYVAARAANLNLITFDPSLNPVQNYHPYYNAGGLWANNTSLTLTLPMGHRYLARIKAVNTAGDSILVDGTTKWTYVNLSKFYSKSTDDGTQAAASDATYTVAHTPVNAAFNSESINIYKVIYHLNGGRYATKNDPATSDFITSDFIVFNIQDKTPCTAAGHNVSATPLDFWDGLHFWQNGDDASNMLSKKFGGSLKVDPSAANATAADGTGAADAALLGGINLKFDTDGNLKYEYATDANFGKGSLQLVMDTDNHEDGVNDVAAFKNWVDDNTSDTSYPISAGYKGYENIELWARYYEIQEPVPDATGFVTYDDPTKYNILPQWIEYGVKKLPGDTYSYTAPANVTTAPKISISKGTDGTLVGWQITVPECIYVDSTAYGALAAGVKEFYRKTEGYVLTSEAEAGGTGKTFKERDIISLAEFAKLSTTDQANYTKVDYMYGIPTGVTYDSVSIYSYTGTGFDAGYKEKIAPAAHGSAKPTTVNMDISKWKKGQTYRVVFIAKYGKYSYETSVNVTVTD